MLLGVKTELKILSVGLLVAGVCGWLVNLISLCMTIFLLAYFFWHLLSVLKFLNWVDNGMKHTHPNLQGIWLELINMLEQKKLQQIKSIKRMRQAVKRTSQLTHAIDEGILVLKNDLRLSWWNATAKKQLGL